VPTSGGTSAWARAHPIYRYVVAVLFAALATALKVAFAAYLVPHFILAYPAVLLAAALGGVGPGILATLLSAAMVWKWVLPEAGVPHAVDVQDLAALAVFVVMGALISLGGEWMRRSQRRIDRLEKERELAALEERFKVYVEESPDGIIVADRKGRVVDANPAATRMIGFDLATLKTKRTLELVHPDARDGKVVRFSDAARGGAVEHDQMFMKGDGSTLWVRLRLVKLSDDRYVAFCRDVTDRRIAEQDRERLITELREAAASVRTLSGLLPICMYCKKIRTDTGYWDRIEKYISSHTDARFSHGICGDCLEAHHPETALEEDATSG